MYIYIYISVYIYPFYIHIYIYITTDFNNFHKHWAFHQQQCSRTLEISSINSMWEDRENGKRKRNVLESGH